MNPQPPRADLPGVSIAALLLTLWAALLAANLLYIPWQDRALWPLIPLAIAAQTFLYTGVFITAHDAMHGVVAPGRRWLNDGIGHLCTRLYALFSFKTLRVAHHKHHAAPGTADDPDFHDGHHPGLARWYWTFLTRYVRWRQIVGMAILFNLLAHGAHIPEPRLIVFWVIPSLASTVQLFYFGTYLPHRGEDHADHHHARSNKYSVFWSFLSCYHFGYHWEHHQWPYVPWWRLPTARRAHLQEQS
jgi:beta-carotene/zeaxanthin 4-ketolase